MKKIIGIIALLLSLAGIAIAIAAYFKNDYCYDDEWDEDEDEGYDEDDDYCEYVGDLKDEPEESEDVPAVKDEEDIPS